MNQIFLPDFYSSYLALLSTSYPDRISVILIATLFSLFLGLFFGRSERYAIPFTWKIVHRLFNNFASKADKMGRSTSSLIFRGTFITIMLLTGAAVASFCAYWLVHHFPLYRGLDILLVIGCISTGQIIHMLGRVHSLLSAKGRGRHDEALTYNMLAKSSRSDLNVADNHMVAREASAFATLQFERAYIGPTLFYLLFGFTGLFVATAVSSGMWLFGREGQGKGFQMAISTLQRILGLLTAPLTLMCYLGCSLIVPAASLTRAFSSVFIWSDKPPYLSGGKALQILSHSLSIAFGGAKKDPTGRILKREWVGPKGVSAKMNVDELKRVQYWIFASILVYLALLFANLVFLA
ncbi:MAG: hypothetical protein CMH25_01030 [Micavibrio sp.]|nr:hypothetical protein [Micavibrio sp.]|tara:strand:+ start:207443 stop:208495 length:1053 start_codon:yes stop_codon:yes gene_type:complete